MTTKNRLLRSQANEVFLMLQNAGLPVSEFRWIDRDTHNPTLTHDLSGHYLKMLFTEYGYYVGINFSPADYQFEETAVAQDWETVRSIVQRWITYLKRELQEPDFWQMIAREKTLIDGIPGVEAGDLPFSPSEQERIRRGLDEIKAFLASTQPLNNDQLRIIEQRLDYLADASTRIGRKDWLMLATG